MATHHANGDSRISLWLRVREFAVPPSLIETATARRSAGDWAGACAAAGFDVDLDLRAVARVHGRDLAARIRADLRHLAPDLLRWHLPRVAPDGLLRPGVTIALARYATGDRDGERAPHLVVRTAPAWADAGQRISLALWDGGPDARAGARHHPHPRPARWFRLDLHRHLWDARRAHELRSRSGADRPPAGSPHPDHWAVDRWAAEAGLLLAAEGRRAGPVAVRAGARHRLIVTPAADEPSGVRIAAATPGAAAALPLLPDAATRVPPDLVLLRAGAITADRLHPLVAEALAPGHDRAGPASGRDRPGEPRVVECRGARHRIGLVDGVLVPLDHDPAEIRREELLAALTGTPLPCLQAVDEAHRRPACLADVRFRLAHGDTAGALAAVEALVGPGAALRGGPLRDALAEAARRRVTHGLYRAGLAGPPPGGDRPASATRPRDRRGHPRHAATR
jgi:hypothetical protein